MIKHRVAHYIEKEGLLTFRDKALVALSGGADSIALLHLLHALGYTFDAAHCNFHLRGEESDKDEAFVRQVCQKQNVPLHVMDFDTRTYARNQKISIEMAARELRYQWFETLAEEHGYATIAVAHHQDDSVETMLLNLIRGAGINGLSGIRPKNGKVIRPLLCVTRNEVVEYLNRLGQEYVIDSTNLQEDYTRNKIRLTLLPLMQKINPSVKERLFQTTNYLNEALVVYRHAIEEGKTRVQTDKGIVIAALLAEPSPTTLLFEILHPLGFNSVQVGEVMQSITSQPGKQFVSRSGWRVIKDREWLLINKIEAEEKMATPFQLIFEETAYTSGFNIIKNRRVAYFDTDKLRGDFTVRKWEQGDTFVPFGMTGKKLISDFLTDRKFSIPQKENQWVLCSGQIIAWVIGERTDNRFRIDESTRRVTIVKLQ